MKKSEKELLEIEYNLKYKNEIIEFEKIQLEKKQELLAIYEKYDKITSEYEKKHPLFAKLKNQLASYVNAEFYTDIDPVIEEYLNKKQDLCSEVA